MVIAASNSPPSDSTRELVGRRAECRVLDQLLDARALLDAVLQGPIDARVRDQIVAETRGNPLALLELPRLFLERATLLTPKASREQPRIRRIPSPRAGMLASP